MGEIAGLPYWEIAFDEKGRPNAADADALTAGLSAQGVTDLMMFAHGWNNDRGQASALYRRFFEQVPGLLPGGAAPALGFVGVIWPSKRWSPTWPTCSPRRSSAPRSTSSASCWPPGPTTRPRWSASRR